MRRAPGGRLVGGLLATSLVLGGGLLVMLGAIALADAALAGSTPVSLGVGAVAAGASSIGAALLIARILRR